MTRIVIDEVIRQKLRDFKEVIELCDDRGRVVARVMPTQDITTYRGLQPPLSDEELAERKRYTGPMRTAEEVLKRLDGLEKG